MDKAKLGRLGSAAALARGAADMEYGKNAEKTSNSRQKPAFRTMEDTGMQRGNFVLGAIGISPG
jgi:hypothetical protein